jgi:hypothetical protein
MSPSNPSVVRLACQTRDSSSITSSSTGKPYCRLRRASIILITNNSTDSKLTLPGIIVVSVIIGPIEPGLPCVIIHAINLPHLNKAGP